MSRLNRLNDQVWSFFTSVDLAVALFIVISAGASIGTIIPQQNEPDAVIRFLTKFFSVETATNLYEFISLLELNNVYQSWWFTFLLFLFALNLIVCSIDRLPALVKSLRQTPVALPKETLERMPFRKTIKLSIKTNTAQAVEDLLKRCGYSVHSFISENERQIHVRKWAKTRLAVYLTHFSIILILAGALVGTFFGFRGYMNIAEGQTLEFAISDEGKAIPLDFKVKCEKFEVEYYEDSFTPKAFRSYIKIIEGESAVKIGGKEIFQIEVNEPFSYKGISFYQASYGFQPSENAEFRFTFTGRDGKEQFLKAKFEENFEIPGTNVKATVVDFSPALGIDESGRLINISTEMVNPAVLVLFEDGKKREQHWILKNIPETWETPFGILKFDELWGAHFTGLQVRKDPGVPLIYLGSILMGVGLLVSLFFRPIRFYVTVRSNEVSFYFPLSKGSFLIEKRIDEIIKRLQGQKE